jgi:hypothetical protein
MLRTILLLVGVSCGLTACSMLSSDLFNEASIQQARHEQRPVCSTTAGSYHVSKTYFRLRVDQLETAGGPVSLFRYVTVQRRPDRTMGYCLDLNPSITSTDKVRVYKTNLTPQAKVTTDARANANGDYTGATKDSWDALEAEIKQTHAGGSDLLQVIATDSIDETAYIAKVLIRTLFVGLSGNSTFNTDRAITQDQAGVRKLDLEYDPFDLQQTAAINDALRKYGFCVLVQGVTFERESDTIDSYCDHPKQAALRAQALTRTLKVAEEAKVEQQVRGVLYRPRLPYTVTLFVKNNLKLKGGWRLRASEIVEMENISPVLSLGIERAIAAQRKTMVFFDQGVVQNVCIFKSSELQPLVEIPLEIARSVVALPANVVQVQISSLSNDKQLVDAQDKLIKAQINHLKLLDAQQRGTANDVSANDISVSKDPKNKSADETGPSKSPSTYSSLESLLKDGATDTDYTSARAVRGTAETVCSSLSKPETSAVTFAAPFGFSDTAAEVK